ncbi:metallophosphoesterase [Enhygromyxa salina]|uniref:metallophosphoesterase n=1 Tax=Enhygromyxa salina TaxID=215803 RepID=UPI0011B24DED|nr:metallophosphoesterase [Enhygromyxa salina]
MATITHLCLSDLHLGAETSLLTQLDANGQPLYGELSPVLDTLIACIRDLLAPQAGQPDKPTLVLAGDVLELALAHTHEAAMSFERFLLALFPGGEQDLFSRKVLLLPGNHDHHLWEAAREQYYVDFLRTVPVGQPLGPAWSVTRLYAVDDGIGWPRSVLLESLARRHPCLADLDVELVYPNYGLVTPDRTRTVVITHGHYVEPIYMAMSALRTFLFPEQPAAATIEDIQQENFAWVDFFWSTMGRSGAAGDGVQRVYEMAASPGGIDKLSERVAKGVVKHWGRPMFPDALEQFAIKSFVKTLFESAFSHERGHVMDPLSEATAKGLDDYITGPLNRQIRHERRHDRVPEHLTVVFGHTHKPFERRRAMRGFAHPVVVFNTGGWVVDKITAEPLYGGAIVVVDEDLNCASLRMYNEPERGARPQPVRVAAPEQAGGNPLAAALASRLAASQAAASNPWARFTEAVGFALEQRAWALERRSC